MTRKTNWIDLLQRPAYRGRYELRRNDNSVVLAQFRGKYWYDVDTKERLDISPFKAWRGRNGLQKMSVVVANMAYLQSNRSRRYVRKLFRHWVSGSDYVEASLLHKIGTLLKVKFSTAERAAFEAFDAELTAIERNAVDKRFNQFWLGRN